MEDDEEDETAAAARQQKLPKGLMDFCWFVCFEGESIIRDGRCRRAGKGKVFWALSVFQSVQREHFSIAAAGNTVGKESQTQGSS